MESLLLSGKIRGFVGEVPFGLRIYKMDRNSG